MATDCLQAVPLYVFGSCPLILVLISMSVTSVITGDLNIYTNYNKFLQIDQNRGKIRFCHFISVQFVNPHLHHIYCYISFYSLQKRNMKYKIPFIFLSLHKSCNLLNAELNSLCDFLPIIKVGIDSSFRA